jgi:hypothetical protein
MTSEHDPGETFTVQQVFEARKHAIDEYKQFVKAMIFALEEEFFYIIGENGNEKAISIRDAIIEALELKEGRP